MNEKKFEPKKVRIEIAATPETASDAGTFELKIDRLVKTPKELVELAETICRGADHMLSIAHAYARRPAFEVLKDVLRGLDLHADRRVPEDLRKSVSEVLLRSEPMSDGTAGEFARMIMERLDNAGGDLLSDYIEKLVGLGNDLNIEAAERLYTIPYVPKKDRGEEFEDG